MSNLAVIPWLSHPYGKKQVYKPQPAERRAEAGNM
jgi:hypothetical protein